MNRKDFFKTPRPAKKIVDCSTITNDQWLKYRTTGIGGSDCAAILGISHFRTPLQLYYDKTNYKTQKNNIQKDYLFEFGHAMEAFVAEFYEKHFELYKDNLETNISLALGESLKIKDFKVYRDTWFYQHPEYPFMNANLDFKCDITFDTGETVTGIFECKTTSIFTAKDNWAAGPPDYYVAQTRHYMAVMDVPFAIIACACDNNFNNYYSHFILRDKKKEEKLIEAELDFWDHVQKRIPVEDVSSKDLEILSEQVEQNDEVFSDCSEETLDILGEIDACDDAISSLNVQVKNLQKEKDGLLSKIVLKIITNDKSILTSELGDKQWTVSVKDEAKSKKNNIKIIKDILKLDLTPEMREQIEKIISENTQIKEERKVKFSSKMKKIS